MEDVNHQRVRKRINESPVSDRSAASPPDLPSGSWPDPAPTQNPYLEQKDVVAFSVATKIKEMSEQNALKQKKKKHKNLPNDPTGINR